MISQLFFIKAAAAAGGGGGLGSKKTKRNGDSQRVISRTTMKTLWAIANRCTTVMPASSNKAASDREMVRRKKMESL